MKKIILLLILLFVMVLQAKIKILEKSKDYIIVEFYLENFHIDSDEKFSYINSDISMIEKVGNSQNFFENIKLVIPPDGSISVKSLSFEEDNIYLKKELAPVPKIVELENDNSLTKIIYEKSKDYSSFSQKLKVEPVYNFRQNSIASVSIYPFSYNKENKKLSVNKKWKFKININGNKNYYSRNINSEAYLNNIVLNSEYIKQWKLENNRKEFNDILAKVPELYRFEIDRDGIYKISANTLADLNLNDIDPASIKIYSTGGKLMDITASFDGLELKEIPLLMVGGEDGNFDEEDYFLFYAHDRNGFDQTKAFERSISGNYSSFPQKEYYNPYSEKTYYWLTWDASSPSKRINVNSTGIPVKTETSFPFVKHFEQNNIFREGAIFNLYYTKIIPGNNFSYNFETLDNVESEIKLNIGFQGDFAKSSTRRAYPKFSVNTEEIYAIPTLNTNAYFLKSFDGVIVQNNNEFVVKNDIIANRDLLLDYFEIKYNRLLKKYSDQLQFFSYPNNKNQYVKYKIKNGNDIDKIFIVDDFDQVYYADIDYENDYAVFVSDGNENTKFYACDKNDFFSIENLEKYELSETFTSLLKGNVKSIIITNKEFLNQANELKRVQEKFNDFKAKVITQQNVFDLTNAGMADPVAIKIFIKKLYELQDTNELTFVTLFGSGTFDWKNNLGNSLEKNKIMIPYAFKIGENPYFTRSTDDYYTFFDDQLLTPSMALGRINVKNTTEADIYIKKIKDYLNNQQIGFWKNKIFALSDDEFGGGIESDTLHTVQLSNFTKYMPKSLIIEPVYSVKYDMDPFKKKPELKNKTVEAVNEGRLIWYYIGHGSYDKLGDEDYFRGSTDLSSLKNRNNLNLFIAASCSVGKYDSPNHSCLAVSLTNYPEGGAIAAYAATGLCSGPANTNLYKKVINNIVKEYYSVGEAFMAGKLQNIGNSGNNRLQILFGDPTLKIIPPKRFENLLAGNNNNEIKRKQNVKVKGFFNNEKITENQVYILAYEPGEVTNYNIEASSYAVRFYEPSRKMFFRGHSSVVNDTVSQNIIIPTDCKTGDMAKILIYGEDKVNNKSFISYSGNIKIEGVDFSQISDDLPKIKIYFDNNEDFVDGETIDSAPILNAEISDDNGINILGQNGHKLFVVIDNDANNIIDVSDGFIYDLNSATSGKLIWQLPSFEKGKHILQLIAYDNYNNLTLETVNFNIDKSSEFKIFNLLPYPNPMKKDGYITFELSQDASVKITIFTVSGKKIKTIDNLGILSKGFNKVFWDGKDADGDYLANNTYFVKVKAKSVLTKNTKEKMQKLVIYK